MSWEEAEQLARAASPQENTGSSKAIQKPKQRAPFKKGSAIEREVSWDLLEDAYVWGEDVRQKADGSFERSYPRLKDLADRAGVSTSRVHQIAKKKGWISRREKVAQLTREEYEKLKQSDQERAKARARRTTDALAVLEEWIAKFAEGLDAGTIKPASMSDLNIALRLRAFLKGEAESRSEQKIVHSLEELASRHLRIRSRAALTDGELGGVLPPGAGEQATDGDTIEAEAELVPQGESAA